MDMGFWSETRKVTKFLNIKVKVICQINGPFSSCLSRLFQRIIRSLSYEKEPTFIHNINEPKVKWKVIWKCVIRFSPQMRMPPLSRWLDPDLGQNEELLPCLRLAVSSILPWRVVVLIPPNLVGFGRVWSCVIQWLCLEESAVVGLCLVASTLNCQENFNNQQKSDASKFDLTIWSLNVLSWPAPHCYSAIFGDVTCSH